MEMNLDHLGVKRCTKCGEMKDLSEFYRNRARPDGRNNECRACSKSRTLDYTARLKSEIGEDEFRRRGRERVQRSRDNEKSRVRAYNEALKRVRDAHKEEFDRYLAEENLKNLGRKPRKK